MKISNNKVVQFHYSIKISSGEVVDSTFGDDPMEYVHGVDELMEGLTKVLEGKEAKDSFEITISAEEAYGPKVEELIFKVSRSQFPPDAEFKEGGAHGLVRNGRAFQVIVGLDVPQVREAFDQLVAQKPI